MAPDWLLGIGRADITPTRPTALAGFATRATLGPAAEIASPLTVRALALRPAGDQDPATTDARTTVIVAADLLCWGDDTAAEVYLRCAETLGLSAEQIVLHATHTHSAPQPSTRFHPGLGLPDPDWVELVVARTVSAIASALVGREPASVHTATGEAFLGVERRHARTGGRWPAAPLDRRLRVVTVRRRDGSVAAAMFHHACHPTIHHANQVSAEFPGAAMSRLEREGHAIIALYLQGCCGDINPDRYRGSEFVDGDQAAVEQTGERLSAAVVPLLSTDTAPIPADPVHTRRAIALPTAAVPSAEQLQRAAGLDDPMIAGWARLLLARPVPRDGAQLIIHRVRLGPGLELLAFSAELTSRYGWLVEEVGGAAVWPLGYTGGMLGYLVTDRQLAEGGYEADEAPYWFGMDGPLEPGTEDRIRRAVADALGRPDRDELVIINPLTSP